MRCLIEATRRAYIAYLLAWLIPTYGGGIAMVAFVGEWVVWPWLAVLAAGANPAVWRREPEGSAHIGPDS